MRRLLASLTSRLTTLPGARPDAIAQAPAASRRLLYGAAFFSFWSLGFIVDVMRPVIVPAVVVIVTAVLTGLTAVAFVYVATFHRRWFAPFVVLMVALMIGNAVFFGGDRGVPIADADLLSIQTKLLVDGVGCVLGFTLSYSAFMGFIGAESTRHARIVAEIELAREIHGLLVPAIVERHGRYEFYGVSAPSTEVGGDLVDVIPAGPRWLGYVADVSGHGVGAGLLMGMVKSAMRTRMLAGGPLADVVTDVNGVLHPLRKPNMFVTLAGVHDDGDGLAVTVAGHPPVLHYRAETGTIDELTVPQVPLAMFEGRQFSSMRVTPASGDLLAIITDGLTEVFDRNDAEFGLERLKMAVKDAAARPLPELAAAVLRKTRDHGVQSDDQTLLLIRVMDGSSAVDSGATATPPAR